MILSVSRRTDIPSFYFDWFLNRLRAGEVLVRNPFNPVSVSRIPLSPATVEGIVFWSKNPEPMLSKLAALAPYPFYIQYTVNSYGADIESRLPALESRLDVFRALAEKLGRERVVWRYSPVVVNSRYSSSYHLETFDRLAHELTGYTLQCKLSFLEMYQKIAPRMHSLGVVESADTATLALARQLAAVAERHGIALGACGKPDLRPTGIPMATCVDGDFIRRLTGRKMSFRKDPGQRGVCNCVESVDIGSYHTCLNGCAYCYANHSHDAAVRRARRYDPASPFLCDSPRIDDRIAPRKIRIHSRSAPAAETTGEQLSLKL